MKCFICAGLIHSFFVHIEMLLALARMALANMQDCTPLVMERAWGTLSCIAFPDKSKVLALSNLYVKLGIILIQANARCHIDEVIAAGYCCSMENFIVVILCVAFFIIHGNTWQYMAIHGREGEGRGR